MANEALNRLRQTWEVARERTRTERTPEARQAAQDAWNAYQQAHKAWLKSLSEFADRLRRRNAEEVAS